MATTGANQNVNLLLRVQEIIVQAIHRDVQTLRDELFLRFQEVSASIAGLRIELDGVNDSVTNIQGHLDNRLDRLHELTRTRQENIRDGLTQIQTHLNGRRNDVEECTAAVQNYVDRRLKDAEQNLEGKIGDMQLHVIATNNTLYQGLDRIQRGMTEVRDHQDNESNGLSDRLDAGLNRVETRIATAENQLETRFNQVQESTETTRTHFDTRLDQFDGHAHVNHNRLVVAITAESNRVHQAVEELRRETRAGHFNNAARLANRFSSCCNTSISVFHGVDDQRIPDLPRNYSEFHRIGDEINTILRSLGLGTDGNFLRRQNRLKTYLGLRK